MKNTNMMTLLNEKCEVVNNTGDITDDNWRMLATAIVIQAVRDYEKAIKENVYRQRRKDSQYSLEELRQFFSSEWCAALISFGMGEDCNYSSGELENMVDKMIKNKNENKKKEGELV